MVRNITVGIDIGSSAVQSVISAWDRKRTGLSILGLGSAEAKGIRKGRIIDMEAASNSLKASLRKAERQANVRRVKSAFLAVGGISLEAHHSRGVIAVSRASGEISEYDARRALEVAQSNIEPLANREILHGIPMVFTIDGSLKTVSPVGMAGTKLECQALFISAIQKDIRNLVKCAEMAGLAVEDLVAAPLAASRAILPKRHKEVGTLLMDVGSETVSLAVFEEGIPISLEVLSIGSANITHDLAIGFRTSLEEAEVLKRSFDAGTAAAKKQLADIISARLSDIFELTNKHLKKIERQRLLPAGVVVTGGGARLEQFVDFARDYLELPVQIGSLQDTRPPTDIAQEPWSVAVGLCLLSYDSVKGKLGPGLELTHRAGNIILRWLKSLLP